MGECATKESLCLLQRITAEYDASPQMFNSSQLRVIGSLRKLPNASAEPVTGKIPPTYALLKYLPTYSA
jgi:hypothetical protein